MPLDPETAIRRYHAGTLSLDRVFRVVVSYGAWQMAILPDGSPFQSEEKGAIWTHHLGRYLHVVTEPDAPYYERLEPRWTGVDGRDVIREYLPNYDGLLLTNGGWVNLRLSADAHRSRLNEWCRILELEEALGEGTEPEAETLLNAPWYVLQRQDAIWLDAFAEGRYACLFSAPDRPGEFIANELARWLEDGGSFALPEVRQVDGPDLFALLAAQDDLDGVQINPGSESAPRPWGPHAARELLDGLDPRLERRILRARSRQEMRLLMDQLGASYDQTSSFETMHNEIPVVEYSSWSPSESFSLRFVPIDESAPAGDEATELLCAGVLADWVRSRIEIFDRPPDVRPSNLAEWAREALDWLDELELLLDPSDDRIPRRAVRLPKGSEAVRRSPEILTGEWLRRSRALLTAFLSHGDR